MRRISAISVTALCLLATITMHPAVAGEPPQYHTAGSVSGGTEGSEMVLSQVRFGKHDDFTRMVIEFRQQTPSGELAEPNGIPEYEISYREHPYRLILRFNNVSFNPEANVEPKDALPFTVITSTSGGIKELQIYLDRPNKYKVIEVGWDDIGAPRLAIDVAPTGAEVPRIYTVQVLGPESAAEGFALAEQGEFPPGYQPEVLVLGDVVVVEQVFSSIAEASAMDSALRELGYESIINERRGDELPQG